MEHLQLLQAAEEVSKNEEVFVDDVREWRSSKVGEPPLIFSERAPGGLSRPAFAEVSCDLWPQLAGLRTPRSYLHACLRHESPQTGTGGNKDLDKGFLRCCNLSCKKLRLS